MTKKKRRAWRRKRGLKGSEGNEPEALPLAVVDKGHKVDKVTLLLHPTGRHLGLLIHALHDEHLLPASMLSL